MPLTQQVTKILQSKAGKPCRRAIEDYYQISFYTVDLWLKENNKILTTPESLAIISAYTKIDVKFLYIMSDSVRSYLNVPQH